MSKNNNRSMRKTNTWSSNSSHHPWHSGNLGHTSRHGYEGRYVPSACAFGNCGPISVNWNTSPFVIDVIQPNIPPSINFPFVPGACYGADGSCTITDSWQCNSMPFQTYHVPGQPCQYSVVRL